MGQGGKIFWERKAEMQEKIRASVPGVQCVYVCVCMWCGVVWCVRWYVWCGVVWCVWCVCVVWCGVCVCVCVCGVFLLSRCEVCAGVWTGVCTSVCIWLLHLAGGVKFTSLSMSKQKGTGVWYWVSVQHLSLNFIPVHSEPVSQKESKSQAEGPCTLHPG
jgi:hypothetical protein